MHTIHLELGPRSYEIHVGRGLIGRPDLLLPLLPQPKVAVVTNTTVGPLYLDALATPLRAAGVEVVPVVLPDGEAYKTWETLNQVFDALLKSRCERRSTIIALGGGVIGDIAGFAAASYQRGVPFIQVPTTLLAQVDSSVGGKTGINHPLGKNMIGAFYQPRLVLADIATLDTLPDRELSAGIAEVIKYGLIRDPQFFGWLEEHMDRLLARDADALAFAVRRSCENKAAVVAEDETESGARALLNLGHTFGHAIEAGLGFGTWLHGEAVGAGMMMAADLSRRMGLLDDAEVGRVRKLLQRARLPVHVPDLGKARYIELMGVDKKVEHGRIRFVLLRSIGQAFVTDEVPPDLLHATLQPSPAHA